MVSSEDVHATQIGAEVLARGGNAIDAAVAVGYALAVTHPVAGSLGGGGFMMVRLADGSVHAIDYREMAPAKATRALNEKQLKGGAHGYLSAPVPGVVAGLDFAHDKFGTVPLRDLLAPSIDLADKGHDFSLRQSQVLGWYWKRLHDATLKAIFGTGPKDKDAIGKGQLLKQPRLAETLRAIATNGDAGFYQGAVAKKIADAMAKQGGLVSEKDLADYRAKEREPLHFVYRGLDVYTMPPPSMGGIAIVSILMNLAEARGYQAPVGSPASLHAFIESARRSYADRRSVGADLELADKAKVEPLLASLLDPGYYQKRQPPIDPKRATPSSAVRPIEDAPAAEESHETTHFSVVDDKGNAVAVTTTLSAAFGAWVVVPGTGVILSNAMGAFSPSGVNGVQPGKRMASSMSPTLIVREGKIVAVVGSPGGDTIPNTVAQVLRNLVDYGMTVDEAVEAPRLHHQYQPDEVHIEKLRPPAPNTLAELMSMGHKIVKGADQGAANCIVIDPEGGAAYGFADPRKGGLALGPSGVATP